MTDKCPYCQSVLAKKRFVKPTVAEVKAYCTERKNTVDPEAFVDFYESKGWMVGKTKMVSWEASVRTWEKTAKPKEPARRMPTSDSETMHLGRQHRIEARPGESMDQYRIRLTREVSR